MSGINANTSDTNVAMPWYMKLFSGIFAWLSGCFFLSFLAAADLLPEQGVSALIIGVMIIGLAVHLMRKEPGPFLSQASLALSVAGHFLIIFSCTELVPMKDAIVIPLTCIILWAILYLPVPSSVHRFFSTILVWASVTTFFVYHEGYSALYFIIPAEWLITLFLSTTDRKIKEFELSTIGKPAAIASVISGFLTLMLLHWSWIKVEHLPFSIFFGIVSLVLIGHFADSVSQLFKMPHVLGTVTIAAMSCFAPPGLMAAISIGILGFGCSNILLSGAATVFLPMFLIILYYDLEVSLAWKSWVLAGSGLAILLIRKIINSMPEAQKAATDAILSGVDGVESCDGVGPVDSNSCDSCKKDVPWKYHKHAFYGTCIFIIFAINGMIIQKELILKNGESVLLKLVPVDPRSLMQGDYMILRYDIADVLEKEFSLPHLDRIREGNVIVTVDENMTATYKEIDNGRKLAPDERRIAFKYRSENYKLGAESFFFQEGHAHIYDKAKYGELKVKNNGATVLVGLRDENFKVLEPPKIDGEKPGWMSN